MRRVSSFLLRLTIIGVLLHVYIGFRLLPELASPAARYAGALWLVGSCLLIPLGMLSRVFERQPLGDRVAWAGLLAMGFFSSLLVLTLARDVLLASLVTVDALAPGAVSLAQWRIQTAARVPLAALAAVVVYSANALVDVRAIVRLYRVRRGECAVSVLCFAGVVLLGVVPGILLAVGLSLLSFVWRAWHPYDAVLGRVEGMHGYHDVSRHPGAALTRGLVAFRWDAPLFHANATIFRDHVRDAIAEADAPVRCVVIAAEPITDVDVTAADMLATLRDELAARRIALVFAEMKGPVKDRLRTYGLFEKIGADHFFPTVTDAIEHFTRMRKDVATARRARR